MSYLRKPSLVVALLVLVVAGLAWGQQQPLPLLYVHAALDGAHWLADVMRSNYMLQGLVGSMCVAWVSRAFQVCVSAITDVAASLLCTCLTVNAAVAVREYEAVRKYVRATMTARICGNASVAEFDYTVKASTQYVRDVNAYLPLQINVDGQRVYVRQDAGSRTFRLYVLGTQRFGVLSRALDAIMKQTETASSGFVVMTLDDNLKWTPQRSVRARSADTVYLHEPTKKALLDDIRNFFGAQAAYERLGRAWRRSHMYCGPPGIGKTTLAVLAASEAGVPLCVLNFSGTKLSDSTLCAVLCNAPSPGIILIEDIDCIGVNVMDRVGTRLGIDEQSTSHQVQARQAAKSTVTLGGLLAALDGVHAHVGHLVISTTNQHSRLDKALTRAGRLGDVMFELTTDSGIRVLSGMVAHFFSELSEADALRIAQFAKCRNWNPATLEAIGMGVAPFLKPGYTYDDVLHAMGFQLENDIPKDDFKSSGMYWLWKANALELWPDFLRVFGTRCASYGNCFLLPRAWRRERSVTSFLNVGDGEFLVRAAMDKMFVEVTTPQLDALLDIVRTSDVRPSAFKAIVKNNLDDYTSCLAEIRDAATFRPEYIGYSNAPLRWQDIVPFMSCMEFDAMKSICNELSRRYPTFADAVADFPDAVAVRQTTGDQAKALTYLRTHFKIEDSEYLMPVERKKHTRLTRGDIAKALMFAKATTRSDAWALARKLCGTKQCSLISMVHLNFWLGSCVTANDVIDAALAWEAEYARVFGGEK